jgi:hypothetical protein
MSWRRRLRDIAVAGGLAGCTTQAISGGTSGSGGNGGHGGATSSATGVGGDPIPACNANPDPCCPCSLPHYGQGGYGGAGCVDTPTFFVGDAGISCAGELACAQAPTKECCDVFSTVVFFGSLFDACADAGPGDAGTD